MGTVPGVPPACTSAPSIAPVPAAQTRSIEKAVTAFVGTHLTGLGQCGHGLVVLTLTPGSESLAQQVRAKFGPSVQIMVGYTVWNGHPGRSPTCGTLAEPTSTPAGYTMNLDLGSRTVRVGGNLTGHVALHDTSAQGVEVLTGSPIEVVITNPGTRRVVGIDSRPIAGTGYAALLDPGQTKNVAMVGGTARCDGGIGSALPPGHYDAVAEVSGVGIDGPGEPGGTPPPTYFTPFVPIQIVR
ncbi:MAG: hypothetical protein ACLPVF_19260 [Acidimicrobiales bacterium]